jgi:hypothetical protein
LLFGSATLGWFFGFSLASAFAPAHTRMPAQYGKKQSIADNKKT